MDSGEMEAEHKFIGREKLSEDLVSQVVSKKTRVICLDGEPGIGVSRFAEFCLRRVEEHQQHTCFFIDCQKVPGKTKEEVEENFKTCFEEDVIQKTVTKSSTIFDSSNRQEMIDDLVKKFAAFLHGNQESHVNLLLDNIDRNSKGIVQSFVINALKSFKRRITNVTFILTSRMKLSFSQFKMESVKIQPFTKDEVRKFFLDNFDFSFREDVFRIVHDWCGGNVTVLCLVGRELRDLEDMSFDQEDLSAVIVQGSSQDALRLVNSESLADEEKWSQIFARFFEQLARRAQDHLQKVAYFASDFTAEDLNKMRPNESVALTKHRVLVELMRTNAIRHNRTDKTFKVDQLTKQWLATQEKGTDEDCWLDPSNHGRDDEVQDTKTDPFSESMDDNTQQPVKANGQVDGNIKPGHITLNELLRQRNVISEPSQHDGSNQSSGELKNNTPDIAGTGPLESPARSERCDNVTLNIVASDGRPMASSTPSLCQPQGCVNLCGDPSPKEKLPERFKDLSIKPCNLDNNTSGFEGRSVDLGEFNGYADPSRKQHIFSESSVDSFENNELQPTAMPTPFRKSASIPEQDEPHAMISKDKGSASVVDFVQGSPSQHVEQTLPYEHTLPCEQKTTCEQTAPSEQTPACEQTAPSPCRQTEASWTNVPSDNDRIESQTLLKFALMADQPREASDVQGCDHEQFNMTSSGPFAMAKKTKDDHRNLLKQDAVDKSEWHADTEENHQNYSAQKTESVMGRTSGGEGHLEGHQDLASGMRHNSSYFDSDTPATVRPPPDRHLFGAFNRTNEERTNISSRRSDTGGKDVTDKGAQNVQNSRTVYVQPIQCTSVGLPQGCTPSDQQNIQYPSLDQSARSYVEPIQLFQTAPGDVLEQQLPHYRLPCPGSAVTLNSQHYPRSHFPLNTQSHPMRGATWHSQPQPRGGGQTRPALRHNVQQQSSAQIFSSSMAQLPLLASEYSPDSTQSQPVPSFPSHISTVTPSSNHQNPQHRCTSSGTSSIRLHPQGPQGPWGVQIRHAASQPLQQPTQNSIPSIHLIAQQQQYYQQQQQWQQQQQYYQQQQQWQQQQQYYQQQQQVAATYQQNLPSFRFQRNEPIRTPMMCAMQPESAGFISHVHQH
ncbi:uncharacterized protein LOC124279837 [Haliotis rubra]|uniref:uncharacterized protein LOC124279837 n=1 Tax=Haliotis rubra TaxID=36100 RepID=UPI001EE5F5BE|nr:uncharacterized protein LOC124279837 [Haliotis rubra]